MNVSTEKYIAVAKDIILEDDIESLEELWYSIAQVVITRSKAISYDLIFKDSYFFAINRKKVKSVKWLETYFESLDPVIQNKLKQTMTYAKYLKKTRLEGILDNGAS